MDELIYKIEKKLTGEGKRLSVVSNPDGFLKRPDTQQEVLKTCGLLLLPVSSSLELRVRYELTDKNSNERICYIMDNAKDILPDIGMHIHYSPDFNVTDLFPACDETEIRLAQLNFGMAAYIYSKHFVYNLSAVETRNVVNDAKTLFGQTDKELISELDAIPLNWEDVSTIDGISKVILKSIKQDIYEKLESKIAEINNSFQEFIDRKYFGLVSSSHVNRPKMVHKVLPHLAYKYERTKKVALVVIDGMAYWQYLVLEQKLNQYQLPIAKNLTFSWLPSITKLSRQAIFRGDIPRADYNQSPGSECKLWDGYWMERCKPSQRMKEYEIAYTHDSLLTSNGLPYKQAFVDVSLDHKMHSSSNNKDLYSLTENWATEASESINELYKLGYTIVITTDHGNIMAHRWRALNSQERTLLYEKESRGSRHLMYSKQEYLNDFLQKNKEIESELLIHDNWAVWRNNQCFKGQDEITHGGSHFLEVVIPFITITNN